MEGVSQCVAAAVACVCAWVALSLTVFAFFLTLSFGGGRGVRGISPDFADLTLLACIGCLSFSIAGCVKKLCDRFMDATALYFYTPTIVLDALVFAGMFAVSRVARFSLFGKFSLRALLWGGAYGIVGAGMSICTGVTISFLWLMIFGELPKEQTVVSTFRNAENPFDLAIQIGCAAVLAPFAEEVLFRGVIYRFFKGMKNPFKRVPSDCNGCPPRVSARGCRVAKTAFAAVFASLLFAAIHANAFAFTPIFLLSVILILSYEKTASLYTPVTAHAVFNAINIAVILKFGI